MTEKQQVNLDTPVLFLVFNRLDTTKQVFEEIRKARPEQLFIAADGPRNKEEKNKTDAVRKYVLDNIDWKCEVKKLFRKKNLSSKIATPQAIDWFFENVEQGIILEDDCLPSQSFFWFCQELLEKYKEDENIFSISGSNFIDEKINIRNSYSFSKYPSIWGWATWKKAWEKRDLMLEKYIEAIQKNKIKKYYPGFFERIIMKRRLHQCISKSGKKYKIKHWDAPWSWTHVFYKKLSIIPKENLVENIGFSNTDSTNTKENYWDIKFMVKSARELDFPLKHPKEVKLNKEYSKRYLNMQIKRIILKKTL